MGRSVSYPTNAVVTFGFAQPAGEWFHDDNDWDYEVDLFRRRVRQFWPSTRQCDEWLDREDRAVMENDHAYFGMSAYGGLVAYWVVAKEGRGYSYERPELAEAWVRQIAPRFEREFGDLERVGSMSNGQGVYRAKDGEPPVPDNINGDPVVVNGMVCA